MSRGIHCREVHKRYGENTVLAGVDLTVDAGEFVALASPSGGGKTTLLNILGGLTTADRGSVQVAGADLGALTEDQRAGLRRRSVGVVHQSSYLFPWLSVDENLRMTPADPAGRQWLGDLRDDLGIQGFENTAVNQLSGGQRRRVCILRALQAEPQVLLLDEPTTGLDESLAVVVRNALRTAAGRGAAVLMATHDAASLAGADRTVTLAEKRISA